MSQASEIKKLAERYGDRIVFLEFNRNCDRSIMRELDIRWVPSFLFYLGGGNLVRKLSGDEEATVQAMKEGIDFLLERASG